MVKNISGGKSGCFVECRGVSLTIGILTAFPSQISDCCHWVNRSGVRVPCIWTCNILYLSPAVS